MPLLHVEREHQDSLGAVQSFWCPEDEGIVVNLFDRLYFTDLGTVHIFKLGIKRYVVANRPILILELLETDATHLNAGIA